MFSQDDLDTVLYGYFRRGHVTDDDETAHALTTLQVETKLSYGKIALIKI